MTKRLGTNRRLLGRLTVAVLVDGEVLKPGTSRFRKGVGDAPLVNALRRIVERVVVGPYTDAAGLFKWLDEVRPDLVFNLTEHAYGDRRKDGCICGLLDLLKLPYTGTEARGMVLCRDKAVSKLVAAREGFKTPDFFVARASAPRLPRRIRFPLVVKPRFDDSSVGISQASLVRSREALLRRIAFLESNDVEDVICEEFVAGREMMIGVAGRRVMPAREIVLGRNGVKAPPILSYNLKHDKTLQRRWAMRTRFATLAPAQEREMKRLTLRTFDALDLKDYGRLDLKLTPSGEWVFIEANPNPGLFPFKGSSYGIWSAIDFDRLIAEILLRALQREH